jgi:hypothetical protein
MYMDEQAPTITPTLTARQGKGEKMTHTAILAVQEFDERQAVREILIDLGVCGTTSGAEKILSGAVNPVWFL